MSWKVILEKVKDFVPSMSIWPLTPIRDKSDNLRGVKHKQTCLTRASCRLLKTWPSGKCHYNVKKLSTNFQVFTSLAILGENWQFFAPFLMSSFAHFFDVQVAIVRRVIWRLRQRIVSASFWECTQISSEKDQDLSHLVPANLTHFCLHLTYTIATAVCRFSVYTATSLKCIMRILKPLLEIFLSIISSFLFHVFFLDALINIFLTIVILFLWNVYIIWIRWLALYPFKNVFYVGWGIEPQPPRSWCEQFTYVTTEQDCLVVASV